MLTLLPRSYYPSFLALVCGVPIGQVKRSSLGKTARWWWQHWHQSQPVTTPCPTFSGASSFLRLILMWSTKCFICQSGTTQQLMQILAIMLTSSSLSVHRPLPCPRLFPQQHMDTLLTTSPHWSDLLNSTLQGYWHRQQEMHMCQPRGDTWSFVRWPTSHCLTTRVSPLPVCSGSCIYQGLAPQTISFYLAGIKNLEISQGGNLVNWAEISHLLLALRGINCSPQRNGGTKRPQRLPIIRLVIH